MPRWAQAAKWVLSAMSGRASVREYGFKDAPARGDVIWLDFDPQAGHKQRGLRPALVLSDQRYNLRSGLALNCPVSSQHKPYPFVVALPADLLEKPSWVLGDQIKSVDWRERRASFIAAAPADAMLRVTAFAIGLVRGAN
jgi:mRNA interferase MazF